MLDGSEQLSYRLSDRTHRLLLTSERVLLLFPRENLIFSIPYEP
jgi:hypothetical protein